MEILATLVVCTKIGEKSYECTGGFCLAISQNYAIRFSFCLCLPLNYENNILNFAHFLFCYHQQCGAFYSSFLSLVTP